MIKFFMLIQPPTTTHQTKRVDTRGAKPRFFETQAVKAARMLYRQHLAQHRPEEPLTGPLRLVTKWCYEPKYKPTQTDVVYKPTKPDTDNMIKLLKDEMTRCGFWVDDAQVASEITEKFWATPAGIYVSVSILGDSYNG